MPGQELIDVRLTAMSWDCEGVLRLELRPLSGALPRAEAGAHLDLHLPGGLMRQYSLTAGSDSTRYVLGVLREIKSRGGSVAVHEVLRPGDIVRISPPRNTFPLAGEGGTFLLAGGIGITPLLLMAETLAAEGRPFTLVHCVRDEARVPFREQTARLGARLHVDAVDGLPDIPAMIAGLPEGTHLYCCGPGPMLDAFLAATAGNPNAHIERFEAAKLQPGEGEFVVELAKSGEEIIVASDQTILESLLAAGHAPDHSCQVGVCGTCETRVLEGEPDHRDLVLTDDERAGGAFMICCSRAKGPRLVLDL